MKGILGIRKPTLRLPGLFLDFAHDGEPFDRLRAMSYIEWPAEPRFGVCSGLVLHFDRLSVLSVSKEAAPNPD